jgi:hypothetical protein
MQTITIDFVIKEICRAKNNVQFYFAVLRVVIMILC